MEFAKGRMYFIKGSKDRVVYAGFRGRWHQFEKVGKPGVVVRELLDIDLHLLENLQY